MEAPRATRKLSDGLRGLLPGMGGAAGMKRLLEVQTTLEQIRDANRRNDPTAEAFFGRRK